MCDPTGVLAAAGGSLCPKVSIPYLENIIGRTVFQYSSGDGWDLVRVAFLVRVGGRRKTCSDLLPVDQ